MTDAPSTACTKISHMPKLYNSTNYKNSPFPDVSVMYGAAVCTKFGRKDSFIGDTPWDINWGAFEKYLVSLPNQPIICDIEHWKLNDGDTREFHDSLMMYRAVLKFIKEVRPDQPLGNYISPPVHGRQVTSLKGWWTKENKYWKARCDAVFELSHYLDWITPSLYWHNRSASLAEQYATAVLAEAGRFRALGKEIYPFVMPRAETEGPDGRLIGTKYFQTWMQDSVLPFVDGAIVWDYGKHRGRWPQVLTDQLQTESNTTK